MEYVMPNNWVLKLRPINPILVRLAEMQDRKATPAPKPPVSKVPVAGGVREIENKTDPTYLEALDAYETGLREQSAYRIIILGVDPESIDKDAVTVFRAEMRGIGIELVDNDALVYCTAVATGDAGIDSLRGLVAAIMGQNSPSPEKVEEHLESTFQDNGKG